MCVRHAGRWPRKVQSSYRKDQRTRASKCAARECRGDAAIEFPPGARNTIAELDDVRDLVENADHADRWSLRIARQGRLGSGPAENAKPPDPAGPDDGPVLRLPGLQASELATGHDRGGAVGQARGPHSNIDTRPPYGAIDYTIGTTAGASNLPALMMIDHFGDRLPPDRHN
jgi:hypothetical protein